MGVLINRGQIVFHQQQGDWTYIRPLHKQAGVSYTFNILGKFQENQAMCKPLEVPLNFL